ncbi:MAG: hypothetical protein HQL69_03995 [Magnetococcales bacterium]|nr:hypothetical protein [Magnetococcales bacterium]
MKHAMVTDKVGPNLHKAQNVFVKMLAAIYVGGAYGLVVITLVQIAIVISWFN